MSSNKQKSVLVVDDDVDLGETIRDILVDAGYAVTLLADGRQALEFLERIKPDLLLIDGAMPELDGAGVLTAIKARPEFARIRRVLMSAEAPRLSHADLGLTQFLPKPLPFEELTGVVARLLKE